MVAMFFIVIIIRHDFVLDFRSCIQDFKKSANQKQELPVAAIHVC
jgi:hypothetical protein